MQSEKVINPPFTISDSVGVNSRAPRRINTLFWLFIFPPYHQLGRCLGPKLFKRFCPAANEWSRSPGLKKWWRRKGPPPLFSNEARTRQSGHLRLCWDRFQWGWCTALWYLFPRRRARFPLHSMSERPCESILCSGHSFFSPFVILGPSSGPKFLQRVLAGRPA